MVNCYKLLYYDRDELFQRSFVKGMLLGKASDEQIKDELIKRFNSLSEKEAEAIIQFVREHPNDEDW